MSRFRSRRLLPALLIIVVIGLAGASLSSLVNAFDQRRSAAAAADLRLAVLLVAPVLDVSVLDAEDRALFFDATELLEQDPSDALRALTPELREETSEEIDRLKSHTEMAATSTMPQGHRHSVASHHHLQDLLRSATVLAADNATTAERQTAVFSAGLFASLVALFAVLVRSRVSADVHRSAADRFGTLLDQSPDATAVIGEDGAVTYASAAMHELLGEVPASRSALINFAIAADQTALDAHLESDRSDALCVRSSVGVAASASSREFDVRVVDLSEDPLVRGRLVTMAETTTENRTRRQLEHLAGHDQLTGLPNRRSMMAAIEANQPAALLMIDLDGFKKTNDTLGHGAGDELLVAISRRFESTLPAGAVLHRLGGDEFAVLFDGSLDAARRIAADLLRCLEEPIQLSMAFERARASIGVAHIEVGDRSIGLLRRADIALYEAKRSGGSRLRTLDTDLEHRSVKTSALARSFQNASFDHEFRLVYQPIVDAVTGQTKLVEALARWTSPHHGIVRPDQFIPLAESSGRIVELGDWVLDRALANLAAWRRQGLATTIGISINVSPYQLATDAFPLFVASRLKKYGIDAGCVTLEITESAVVADDELVLERLAELRSMGCSVACDDFGSGYSNLGQLMKLPLNLIKIDRKLLITLDRMREQSGTPDQPCQVMAAMVSIGEAMQAKIVAEGVETVQQSMSLRDSGVHLLQGYLFSRPVEADELIPLIDEPALRSPV